MTRKPLNPFLLAGYHSPEYFCDRREELTQLEEAITNERNVTLFSLRRMGKTALIQHFFKHIEKDIKFRAIYTDLLTAESMDDMVQKLATAVLKKFGDISNKGFTTSIQNFIKKIGARIELDPLTSAPSIKLHYRDSQKSKTSFTNILEFLSKQKQTIIICFDEFQQITKFHEENPEAFIRSIVQEYPGIRFIFSGSHRNIMISMFTGHGKPFYRSTQIMELHPIAKDAYTKFIVQKFRKAKKEISSTVMNEIFEWTRMQTYYIQLVCNRLYATSDKVTHEVFYNMVIKILQEEQTIYSNYRNLLTAVQWKALVALAQDEPVSGPTSGRFLRKHGISSASTMSTALKSLENKELVVNINGRFIIHDALLTRWIQYNIGG
jgi:hypothetical protein